MNTENPDPLNPPKINLKALSSVISELETLESGETFWCCPEEALTHIEEGRVELAEIQAYPPFHILQKLEWKLEYLDQIGLDWRDSTRLQKFQDGAIPGGIRRTMVKGKQLNWIEGISNLRKDFEMSFEIGVTPLGPMLKQIEACWFHKKAHFYEQTVLTKLNDEEMIERGLVCLLHRSKGYMSLEARSKGRVYDLFQVGRDWVLFYLQMQNVKDKLEQALIKCLRTGRVLAVTEKSLSATLVLPSFWDDNRLINLKDGELMFVFSGDLPNKWSGNQKILKGQARIDAVKKAADWLEEEYAYQRSVNLRMTHREFAELAAVKFRLTGRACDDAWEIAHIPEWRHRGSIAKKYRNK